MPLGRLRVLPKCMLLHVRNNAVDASASHMHNDAYANHPDYRRKTGGTGPRTDRHSGKDGASAGWLGGSSERRDCAYAPFHLRRIGVLQPQRPVRSTFLNSLPAAKPATHAEALLFMDRHRLWGRGLGWVDVNLLASAFLSDCRFWTLDKRTREGRTKPSPG